MFLVYLFGVCRLLCVVFEPLIVDCWLLFFLFFFFVVDRVLVVACCVLFVVVCCLLSVFI